MLTGSLFGQDRGDWRLYKAPEDSTVRVEPKHELTAASDTSAFNPSQDLKYSTPDGSATVSVDPRVNEVLEFLGTPNAPDPVKIDGYRAQLFFDQDRDKVVGEKVRFMRANPEIPAYIDWDAPNHYLRIGDYYTKQQAQYAVGQLKESFPSATVYKTKINLPELD